MKSYSVVDKEKPEKVTNHGGVRQQNHTWTAAMFRLLIRLTGYLLQNRYDAVQVSLRQILLQRQ